MPKKMQREMRKAAAGLPFRQKILTFAPMERKKKHTVLFICLGNICRSPAAEGIMKAKVAGRGLSDEFEIDSAGIGGWHVGQLPDRRMREAGLARGYRFDSRARQFSAPADFERFDYIITMDDENYEDVTSKARSAAQRAKVSPMTRFLRHHPDATSVPDPYYGGASGFNKVISLLEDGCEGLIDSLVEEKK